MLLILISLVFIILSYYDFKATILPSNNLFITIINFCLTYQSECYLSLIKYLEIEIQPSLYIPRSIFAIFQS